MRCDHTVDGDVERLFEEITSRHGRLDLVVNVASPDFSTMVGKPFWELPFNDMTRCLDVGPRSNFVTTALAARLMIPQRSGLVINISSHGAESYLLSVPYGVGKGAIDKLTRDTAAELRAHNVAVVSLWPGLVLTEGLLANATVDEDGKPHTARARHQLWRVAAVQRQGDRRPGLGPEHHGPDRRLVLDEPSWPASTGSPRTTARCPPFTRGPRDADESADEIPEFWRGVERF